MIIRLEDTIAAIATPPGEGGICVIRMSGSESCAIADRVFRGSLLPSHTPSHTVLYGHIVDSDTRSIVDEVLLTVLHAPKTYTRQDVVEISGHGGYLSGKRVLDKLIKHGARHAEPGEFTKRAFVNGRIDLIQAEAVAELIRARTDACARAALRQLGGHFSVRVKDLRHRVLSILALIEVGLDFTEEGISEITSDHILGLLNTVQYDLKEMYDNAMRYRVIKDGARVALVGKPNVGKSSLLNSLIDRNRAIVHSSPGTTRDTIEETVDMNGIPVTLVDTAGIHPSVDSIENQGIMRSQDEIQQADLVLVVLDGSSPPVEEDHHILKSLSHKRTCLILNKCDLPVNADTNMLTTDYRFKAIHTSALTGSGLTSLKQYIIQTIMRTDDVFFESDILINSRHQELLFLSLSKLSLADRILSNNEGSEIAAIELRDVAVHLGTIIGMEIGEDVLDLVFSQFCIGK